MGDKSKIEWTDATWNPWHGCHKVSPGCENCYMFHEKRIYGQDPDVVVRSKTKFNDPLRWVRNGRAPKFCFTCSWSDFFINEADPWRQEAWGIIRQTPQITYQILTKRAGRILPNLPSDWGDGYNNAWLGVSVEGKDQTGRIAALREVPARVHFISFEPLLSDIGLVNLDGIQWAIIGAESGINARPMDLEWARSLMRQCEQAGVAVFVKQLGRKPYYITERGSGKLYNIDDVAQEAEAIEELGKILDSARQYHFRDPKGGDPAEWPIDLQVRQLPAITATPNQPEGSITG